MFYLEIRTIHVAAAFVSGAIFLLRATGYNIMGALWLMTTPLRWFVYSIDTVLLTAAMMLMVITQQFPGGAAWLTTKLLLLALYVVLAWAALGRRSRPVRIACSVAGALVFLFVVSVAGAHDPAGIFA